MENQWLAWVKRLHAIASSGIFFGHHEYDKERYREVAAIAEAMLADLGQVPLARIQELFPEYGRGYATPQIDVRAAVFKDDAILLVQEKSDGLWTLPGGYADVGLSAAENTVKEVREEAGIVVDATKLIAVRHKAKHAFRPDSRDFYKFYFECDMQPADQKLVCGYETQAAQFFTRENIPDLSQGRTIAADIDLAYRHYLDPGQLPTFD